MLDDLSMSMEISVWMIGPWCFLLKEIDEEIDEERDSADVLGSGVVLWTLAKFTVRRELNKISNQFARIHLRIGDGKIST